ncbi:MAG: YebC/PmpR family DNA-binding transcriptional regulator [Oscillospiraceae bacterium]|jgi:YebC/PmpR family DNA-binding regulatory protein|nr:YebC/PmpR family DNA-binding transcriptional regulator [Oscillospiraceae bacterium]
MSGHSKWANIKHKKGKADAARGKIFTKIGREIAIAVREGGSDPALNSKLFDVIAKAKANNMPGDNVTRSIKKAAGELGTVSYEEIIYEGYAPGGVAVIVETVTDNRNRTASDIRHIFDKCGGSLGTTNSVGYMFDRKGLLVIERAPGMDEDDMMMIAMESGADDFEASDDAFEITADPADFSSVRTALEGRGMPFLSAEITRVPQNWIAVDDPDTVASVRKLIDMLEDMDDVMNVYHNAETPDEPDEDE